jgi:hypothetical protein
LESTESVAYHESFCSQAMAEVGLMTETLGRNSERRARPRFTTNAPLTVFIGDREIPAYTRDLSNRGAFFYVALPDGALIDRDFEFMVDLPPEITLSTCCSIRCHGRLVRKENTSTNFTGIAAEILQYSILREGETTA